MANDLVIKNNALIDASYTLSLVEQRLIGLALVKANNQHQEITSDTVLTIHAGEYAQQFNVDGSVAYRALKEASERLFLRYFSYTLYGLDFGKEYTLKRPKKLKDGDIPTIMKSRWVQKVGYTESEGLLHFQLTSDVVRLVANSKEYFTSYYLSQTTEFTSTYATRLFELLMKWKNVGHIPFIEIEQLRGQLGVEPKQYKIISNFKLRVLDVAVEQVNQYSDYKIEYEQHKQGRTITGFSFKFQPKATKTKKIESRRDPNTPDFFIKMTDAQRHLFANKMSEMPEMIKYSQGTESYQQFTIRIADMLLQPEKFRELYPILEKAGFKG
ncbi:DNA replication protein (plasmid) [Acinetobacter baumannii SDF]|uniref:DNA replication protein n=1 Tax=Acinetobacter baumannii (strain SDF) TaxID=509170 RepID=B0VVF3_ACIBS|nr:DNA replication protein [Acinetobacter baumannii SDF]